VVERGRTYTFLVHGGNVSSDDANYHPFYITDSMNGGRLLNTQQQRMVTIKAIILMLYTVLMQCLHQYFFFFIQTEIVYAGFNDQDNVTASEID
jgi:hypothetical protein